MRWSIAIAAIILALGLAANIGEGNHRKTSWTNQHVGGVHNGFNDEALCVDENGQGEDWSLALSRITGALWAESRPAGQSYDAVSWDASAGDYRLWFFYIGSGNCDLLTAGERQATDIEYWVWDNTGGGGCIHPSSCLNNWTGPWDEGNGHLEYSKVRVNLHSDRLLRNTPWAGFYRHQVNHETGHVVGLADGPGSSSCPSSIMHSGDYGCPGNGWPSWPTTLDVGTVKTIAEE